MMRASVLLVVFGVLAACGREPDRALRVTVTVKAAGERRVQADCLRLSVLEGTTERKSAVIARPSDDVAVFGVLQGTDLPRSVRLQVSGLLGTCSDPASLKLNAQADPVTQDFPESGVTAVELALEPPGPSLDADRDGFVAVDKGGVDCRDVGAGAASIFPGAGQLCDVNDDTDCDGAPGCDDTQCATALVCASQGDRFIISSTPLITTLRRFECVGPFEVTLANAQGPRATVRDLMVTLASSLPGTTVHGVEGCGDTALTSYPLRYGETRLQVYLAADATAFGLTSLRASAAGVATPGTASVQVMPQPIAQLRFGPAIGPVTAGACSTEQVTLELIDAMGRPTAVEQPASLALTSNPSVTGGLFYSDASCGTAVATAPLAAGQGVVKLYVSSQRAGDVTMSAASSTGQGPVTQVVKVVPAAPSQLAFANQSLAVQSTQSCSAGQLEVELHDAFGNTVSPASDVTVRLSSTLGDLGFRPGTDSTCVSVAQTDFVIPAMGTSVKARVKPGLAGSGSVTARAPTLAGIADATQTIDVAGGPPARILLTGQPQRPLAGECSAAPLELVVQDTAGNPSSFTNAVTVNLSLSPAATGTFAFFTAAGCGGAGAMTASLPAGQSRLQLYFRGTRAVDPFSIGAVITSPSGIPAAGALAGNAVRPNVPGKLVFVAQPPQPVSADNCSGTYTVNVLDAYDNPTAFPQAQDVTVSSVPAGVTIGTGVSCLGSTVTLPANTTSAGFTANHRLVGTYALTATVGGISTSPTAAGTLTVVPGASTLSVSVPAGGAAAVKAGDCQAVTLLRRDAWGNNAPTSGTIALGLPSGVFAYTGACPGGTTTSGGVTSLTLTNNHTVSFNLKPTLVGSPQVSATLGSQVATVNLTVSPGAPVLQFEAPAGGSTSITAGACATVTVARKDLFNNDVPLGAAGSVTFGALPSGMTLHAIGDCGGTAITSVPVAANEARASFLVRSTASGTGQTLQLSLGGANLTLTLGVNPASAIFRFVTPVSGAASAVADGCVTVQVERRDTFNNPVPLATNSNLTFSVTGTASVFAAANCSGSATTSITMNAGTYQQSFGVKSTLAGTHTIRATLAAQVLDLTLTVTPGTPVLQFEAPTGGSATITAGGCTTVTVARKDAFGNDVVLGADGLVTFGTLPAGMTVQAAGDCSGTPITSVAVLGTAARTTFLVRSTKSGTGQTLQITLGGQNVTLTLAVNPGASLFTAVTVPAGVTSATAGQCVEARVTRLDSFGNPVPLPAGRNLTFTPTGPTTPAGPFQAFNSTTCATGAVSLIAMAVGTSSQSFGLRGNSVGTHSMALALDGQNASLAMDIGPAATDHFTVLGLPASITAGACSPAVTVRREDQFGNLTTSGLLNVTLASSRFQFSTASDCSSPAVGGSVSIANGDSASTASVYVTGAVAGASAAVDASAGAIMGTGTTTIVAAAATKLVFSTAPATKTLNVDQCSSLRGTHVVELQDQYNNRVTPGSAVTVNLAGSLTGVTFTGGSTCGTSTASVTLDSGNPTRTFVFRPVTTAPASLDLTAAANGVASAVDTWSVGVGAPALLDWPVTPNLDLPRFTCTDLGVVNIVDAALNATTLTGAAVISVANNRATAGVTLHGDAACASAPITSHSLSAGAGATPRTYAWATGSGGAVNFTPSSVPAPPNNGPGKPATVTGTAGVLTASAAATDVEPGVCVAVTVTRKDAGSVDVTKGVTPITFSVPAGNGLSVHTTSDCSDGTATTVSVSGSIAHGSATATFYVRGRSNPTPGTPVTITAADSNGGSTAGTVNVTSHSLVRRGTCTITDTNLDCTAALTPFPAGNDISRSFLVFTSTGSPATTGPAALAAADQDVECHLDTTSGVAVVCSRVGTNGQMDVSWQVASFGRSFAQGGVSVQHLTGSSAGTSTNVTIDAVTQAQAFVLFSSQFSGADNHGDAFPVARLTSTTNVEIVQNTTAARTYRLQVVSFANATVVHQSGTNLTGQNANLTGLPSLSGAELGRAFALTMAQVTTDSTDADYMCKRRFRSALTTTAINSRRGGGGNDGNCTTDNVALMAGQRVVLPAGNSVQSSTVTFNDNTNTQQDWTGLTSVATHRSLVFMAMQGPGGQTAGDSTFMDSGQDGDDTGYFHARAEFLSATSVRLFRRGSPTQTTSSFQPFVVEFATP